MCVFLQETSSAQYILQQYTAASGGQKLQNSVHNAYTMGKVRMLAFDIETATKVIKSRNSSKAAETGGFVLWQMNPDMWYVELALGGSKVHAGCNGKLVWRHTPWLGAHAAKGPVRPLRRALQVSLPMPNCALFVLSLLNYSMFFRSGIWVQNLTSFSTCRVLTQGQLQTCSPMPDALERRRSTARIVSSSSFVLIHTR